MPGIDYRAIIGGILLLMLLCVSGCGQQPTSQIVFRYSQDWEDQSIYTMHPDGSTMTRLSAVPDEARNIAWSPDGTRLVFTLTHEDQQDIFVMNADGSNVTNLTTHAANDRSPTWSPDGTRIAFVSSRDDQSDLYVMQADGTAVTRLTRSGCVSSPDWSPDGNQIVFSLGCGGVGLEDIAIVNADGTDFAVLLPLPTMDVAPTWSLDGTRIAFSTYYPLWTRWSIYVVNRDGTGLTRLTSGYFSIGTIRHVAISTLSSMKGRILRLPCCVRWRRLSRQMAA